MTPRAKSARSIFHLKSASRISGLVSSSLIKNAVSISSSMMTATLIRCTGLGSTANGSIQALTLDTFCLGPQNRLQGEYLRLVQLNCTRLDCLSPMHLRLEATFQGERIHVAPRHFAHGKMALPCKAQLLQMATNLSQPASLRLEFGDNHLLRLPTLGILCQVPIIQLQESTRPS